MERDTSNWTETDWQSGRDEVRLQNERLHGLVIAKFTVRETASNGKHPEHVRSAWRGVPLPVRERFAGTLNARGIVSVLCTDGYNTLVEAGTDERVLQYWVDYLDGKADEYTTFDFLADDGDYEVVDPRSTTQPKQE